jgi:hypothetical protein
MKTINEKTGLTLAVRFYYEDDNHVTPDTVHWNLHCETSDTDVQDWTSVATTAEVDDLGATVAVRADITISGTLNAIQNDRNLTETKRVLIVANKDAADEFSQEYTYRVRNVPGRS